MVVTLVGAAYLALPLMDRLTWRWFARDLNMRGALIANTLSDSIDETLADPRLPRPQSLFERATNAGRASA